MNFFTSLAFHLAVIVCTIGEAIAFLPLLLIKPERIPRWWTASVLWLAENICGITYEVRGLEYLSHGPAIIAAKHQSAWETFALWHILPQPVFVLKKELLRIPLFGWYLASTPAIAIDRKAGSEAMKVLLEQARRHLQAERQVVIFPEGTRIAPGQSGAHKKGVAALYQQGEAPVIPMALNSGLYWGKNAFLRHPGKIIVEFLPPFPPGLSQEHFRILLKETLDAASLRLLAEATA